MSALPKAPEPALPSEVDQHRYEAWFTLVVTRDGWTKTLHFYDRDNKEHTVSFPMVRKSAGSFESTQRETLFSMVEQIDPDIAESMEEVHDGESDDPMDWSHWLDLLC